MVVDGTLVKKRKDGWGKGLGHVRVYWVGHLTVWERNQTREKPSEGMGFNPKIRWARGADVG